MQHTFSDLNTTYGIPGHIAFEEGPSGFIIASLSTPQATTRVSVYGAHVLSYQRSGEKPVLWVSEHAVYKEGKAIRGGIPVIWPWFGPHPSDASKPSHGFARNQPWQVVATQLVDERFPQIQLRLTDNQHARALWPFPFKIELTVTLADSLQVALETTNTGDKAFTFTDALHSYFNVSGMDAVEITGLDAVRYINQLMPGDTFVQEGPIQFAAETDNIYIDTEAACHLNDAAFKRRIVVEKSGSRSTVVWNPWIAKAARMKDFGDEEYKQMVCIETANAGTDQITLAPGATHTLSTTLRTETLE